MLESALLLLGQQVPLQRSLSAGTVSGHLAGRQVSIASESAPGLGRTLAPLLDVPLGQISLSRDELFGCVFPRTGFVLLRIIELLFFLAFKCRFFYQGSDLATVWPFFLVGGLFGIHLVCIEVGVLLLICVVDSRLGQVVFVGVVLGWRSITFEIEGVAGRGEGGVLPPHFLRVLVFEEVLEWVVLALLDLALEEFAHLQVFFFQMIGEDCI